MLSLTRRVTVEVNGGKVGEAGKRGSTFSVLRFIYFGLVNSHEFDRIFKNLSVIAQRGRVHIPIGTLRFGITERGFMKRWIQSRSGYTGL